MHTPCMMGSYQDVVRFLNGAVTGNLSKVLTSSHETQKTHYELQNNETTSLHEHYIEGGTKKNKASY